MKVLSDLDETLPTIQSQVAGIRVVYDSGRDKVRFFSLSIMFPIPIDMLTGTIASLRSEMAQHRILRTMALYYFHLFQSRLMALEIKHTDHLCTVFHCLFLSLLASSLGCIPGSPSSIGLGRKTDVLMYFLSYRCPPKQTLLIS